MTTTKPKRIPTSVILLSASVSGIASTLLSFPFDVLKNRTQMYGALNRNRIAIYPLSKIIYKAEGFRGFYSGISASCLRQVMFTGTRTGIFQIFLEFYNSEYGQPPSLYLRCAVGTFAGIIGGIAGLPADLVMTRMSVEGHFPPEKRLNYTGVLNAFSRIAKEEGPAALFTGFNATVLRASILNVTQLLSYMKSKDIILKNNIMDDNMYCHTVSSIYAAFCTTFTTVPVDIAKTRIQNMRIVDGKAEYNGVIDAWYKIARYEGILALWKGWIPTFSRNVPQFLFFFLFYEQCIFLYKRLSQ